MKENYKLVDKTEDFALRIIKLYKYLQEEKKEFVLSRQILRSGTSIGANVAESVFAQSQADFVSKISIALKEASETKYWLTLLEKGGFVESTKLKKLNSDCIGIIKMLSSSVKTAKHNSAEG